VFARGGGEGGCVPFCCVELVGVREGQGAGDGSLLLGRWEAGHCCINFRLYLNILVNPNERSWKWRVSYKVVRIKNASGRFILLILPNVRRFPSY
jgi:hypothetical protein